MKTEIENQYTWDDVIFENRNRSYGAYLVRQTYSRNATIAFGASVSFAILLIFSPQIINYLSGGKEVVKPIVKMDKEIIFTAPPNLPPPPIQQAPSPPASTAPVVKNIPPQVIITETDDVILPNDQLLTADPSIGDGPASYVETPGTDIAEVPAVIPPSGPLDIAEVMPAYDGGLQAMARFISKNIRYPKSASSMGIEGSVFVSFVINADGQVVDVKIVRGVSADCDKEAMRVIAKMTEWKAGMMHRQPVAVRMILPIKFQLNH